MAIDLSVLDEEDNIDSISPQGVSVDLSALDNEPSPSSDDVTSSIDLSVLDGDKPMVGDLSLDPFPEQKERKLLMYDEDMSFVQNVDNILYDAGNQFNRTLTNLAGLPLDALGAVVNKAASVFFPTTEETNAAREAAEMDPKKEDNTIGRFNEFMREAAKEYVPSEGNAQKLRDGLNLIPGVNITDEDPRTLAGYITQVGGEAAAFFAPQVRMMQALRASKPASYTGKALKEVSEQFLNEVNENAGRVLAIEAGGAGAAGVARGLLEETDLPVGGQLLAEVVSGIVGGSVAHKLYGVPDSLVKKTVGKNARDIRDMIANGEITYDELTWTPTLRKEAGQVVLTADDQPIFYRGLAREQDLREGIGPGGEKRNPSFTESPSVAKFYAQKRKSPLEEGGVEFTPESIMIGSKLNMKNPLDMTTPGQQTTLREFVEMLDYGSGTGIGDGEVLTLVNYLKRTNAKAKGSFKFQLSDEFDSLNDYIKALKERGVNEVGDELLVDTFALVDAPATGRIAKRLGHDGITHLDVLDGAADDLVKISGKSLDELEDENVFKSLTRFEPSDQELLAQRVGAYDPEELVHTTVRPLTKKQISPVSTERPGVEMPGIVEDSMKLQIARNQNAEALKAQAMANAVEIFYDFEGGRTAPRKSPKRLLDKVVSVLAPSKVVGRSIVNDIEMARGTVARAEELAARVQRGYNRLVKKDPSVAGDLNDFLLKGGRMSKSLEPIETELLQYRGTILQLQKQLLEGLDAEEFLSLSKGAQNQLKEIIEASMEMGYLTQTYRMFLDPNFRPTRAQREAAIEEIAAKKLKAGETESPAEAKRMATEYIDDIVRSSAYQRKADGKKQLDISNVVRESKGILASRTDPGPAERIFLGEVKDPGERLISTASRLSRLASAKAEDVSIAKFLVDSGVATRNQVDPTQVEVKFRTTDANSNVWVSPEVNYAVNVLRFNDSLTGSREIVNNSIMRMYNAILGVSKQTKVIYNPESYGVNLYGAATGSLASGVVPTPRGLLRGMNRALSEFGGLDNVLKGKDPAARKAFLDDLDKMNQYGLKPKSVSVADLEKNILDGFGKLNKASKAGKLKQGFLNLSDFFGKIYSASDTSFRYVVWKTNQDNLAQMFPNASRAQIEAAAARLTNDTFPNYDKLSGIVRTLSRYGLAQQFVPFTAELTRNTYNQGKYAMQMMTGTFGRDIGLDPAMSDKLYMRLQGAKRGAMLVGVTVIGDALVEGHNEVKGINPEDAKQFADTIAAPWDSKKKLLIVPDETGRKGRYINPEYLVPQMVVKQAFDAGFSGKPIESLSDIFIDQYIGELGTFPLRTAAQLVAGRDENGDLINVDARTSEKAKEYAKIVYDDLLRPGAARTIERWSKANQGVGNRTQANNALRLVGFRDNTWDADMAFSGKVREVNEPMRQAKQNYYGTLRRVENNFASPDELEPAYEKANEARKSQMDVLRKHYNDMAGGTLKYSIGERIALMKEAGMSSSDVLDIVEGTYTDLPRTRSQSIGDQYEELEGSPSQKLEQIRSITKDDTQLGQRLASYHKRQMQLARTPGRSDLDKLRASLPEQRRIQYMIDQGAHLNREKLRELREAGIATPSAIKGMFLQVR